MVIMDTSESVGNLEEQAQKRKERLKNLKRKNPSGDNGDSSAEIVVPLPKPKFRSYKPQDESLKEAKLEDAEPIAVEDEVKDLLEAGKEKNRGLPLKKNEVLILVNLVGEHPPAYTKATSVSGNKLKDAAWAKITEDFNAAVDSHPRKPEQLRLKWENLKKNARKRGTNGSISHVKSQYGIPDYVQPDEALDKVAAILGPICEGYRQFGSEEGEGSLDDTSDLSTVVVIPTPSDDEEIAGPIDCVEVGVGAACFSGPSEISKEAATDQPKKPRNRSGTGKSEYQNLMATEVESRIYRNNAIAEYYTAKKRKLEEEIKLNRETLLLQQKKLEIEMLELQNKRGSKADKEKLLIEKKEVELEILELQKKKYSSAASLFRSASEAI